LQTAISKLKTGPKRYNYVAINNTEIATNSTFADDCNIFIATQPENSNTIAANSNDLGEIANALGIPHSDSADSTVQYTWLAAR
jgi:hypothetical protein